MPPNGVKWNLKFKMITFFVFSLFISSMTILVPFTLSRIEQVSISVILGGKGSIGEWSWGIMVNAIPFLIIGGVSLGNKWIEDLESGNFQESSRNNSNIREEKKEKSADWRKLRPTLSHEDLMNLAKLTPDAIRQYAAQTGFTYKTISNWRISARKELGMSEDMERLQ